MATFADATSVREGTMSVLSSGLNLLGSPEFPSPLTMVLALQVELSANELGRSWPVSVAITHAEEVIAQVDGQFEGTRGQEKNSYVSIPLDLQPVSLPQPGTYDVEVTVGSLPAIRLPLYAERVTPDEG